MFGIIVSALPFGADLHRHGQRVNFSHQLAPVLPDTEWNRNDEIRALGKEAFVVYALYPENVADTDYEIVLSQADDEAQTRLPYES